MGLREDILHQPVSQLAMRPLVAVSADITVRATIQAMRDQSLGAAIVIDDQGKPIGMFNEKLLIRLLLNRARGLDEPVSHYMTENIICISQSDPIARLIEIMQNQRLRWVCVTDSRGKAVAITGLRGVLEYIIDHFPRFTKVHPLSRRLAMDQREGA